MARSPKSAPQPPEPVALRVARAEAEQKIQAQINEGEALLAHQPQSKPALDGEKEKFRIWDDFNEELLRSLFTTDAVAQDVCLQRFREFYWPELVCDSGVRAILYA